MKEVKCSTHTMYKGKREPTRMCKECWRLYTAVQVNAVHQDWNNWEYTRLRQH